MLQSLVKPLLLYWSKSISDISIFSLSSVLHQTQIDVNVVVPKSNSTNICIIKCPPSP